MSRSLKKGPFINVKLEKKVLAMMSLARKMLLRLGAVHL